MPKVLLRYTVRAVEVSKNTRLLNAFIEELHSTTPTDLTYKTYLMVAARCISPPEMIVLSEIGTYSGSG